MSPSPSNKVLSLAIFIKQKSEVWAGLGQLVMNFLYFIKNLYIIKLGKNDVVNYSFVLKNSNFYRTYM